MSKKIVDFVKIAWYGKHFGEEPPLVGKRGAGAIFFTGCNLRCIYCQNFQISQQGLGKRYNLKEFIDIMLKLQKERALNIDLVTPTIWRKQIKQAVILAKKKGLKIPIVWNSNAYEEVDDLKEMEGLVDIYLPDFKYSDDNLAFKYSGAKNYVTKATASIKEMQRQVGNLKTFKGIAEKGIIVRHLILPNQAKNSLNVLKIIKKIDKDIMVSLMTQYEPVHKAKDFSEINRTINKKEFNEVLNYFLFLNFKNAWIQERGSHHIFLPDFNKKNPF
ncbi:MAG: radical SAM protein [Patescibacteria group bacterium]|nr:radical SAM protein [Patescibacteria group bacterium]MDD5172687.1 radical SAM protein [Patescibacteria group bacterium]